MGALKHYLNNIFIKKVFILDRNSGKCISGCKNDMRDIYSDRFVERFEQHGDWAFVILDRIPGKFKGGLYL